MLHSWALRVWLSRGLSRASDSSSAWKRHHDCRTGYAFCGSLHVHWRPAVLEPAVKMRPVVPWLCAIWNEWSTGPSILPTSQMQVLAPTAGILVGI